MPLPDPLITISPDFLGGTPVFSGTRVPIKTMFDYLEAGDPLAEFLKQLPTAPADHAIAVLVDGSLSFQQSLPARRIAVILLRAPSNRLSDPLILLPALEQALRDFKPGELTEIA